MWNLRTTTSAVVIACLAPWLAAATGQVQTTTTQKPTPTPTPAPTPAPPAPPAGLQVLWQQPLALPADTKLAPWLAVGDAFIFLASPDFGLTAYSPDDGRTMWSSLSTAASPPATAGSQVAVVTRGVLEVRQQETSLPAWSAPVDPRASVFAFGDRFGVVSATDMRAFDASGAERWKTSLGAAAVTPVVFQNGLLFVGLDAPALVAIDAASGLERWRIRLPAMPQSLAASGDRLYLGAANSTLYSYSVAGDPKPKWKFELLRAVGQPVVDDRHVYFALFDNSVRAFDRDGGTIRWSATVKSRPFAGPIPMGSSLAVTLATGLVEELIAATGKPVPASSSLANDATAQAAAASRDGTRLFTVTTRKDSSRVLTAWGHPVKR